MAKDRFRTAAKGIIGRFPSTCQLRGRRRHGFGRSLGHQLQQFLALWRSNIYPLPPQSSYFCGSQRREDDGLKSGAPCKLSAKELNKAVAVVGVRVLLQGLIQKDQAGMKSTRTASARCKCQRICRYQTRLIAGRAKRPQPPLVEIRNVLFIKAQQVFGSAHGVSEQIISCATLCKIRLRLSSSD